VSERSLEATEFVADVANHRVTILMDSGLYRHLHWSKPQNSHLWFDIVTWPGCLTIRGDMGTWTFSRVEDMFTFFRNDKLKINPSYWAEKLLNGTSGGRRTAQEFDEDVFRDALHDQLKNHYDLAESKLSDIKAALDEALSWHEGEGQHGLIGAAYDFKHGDFQFDGCDLPSGLIYEYQFIWCLYAIVWAIQQYDAFPNDQGR
jgi:hypothetical protein